MLVVIPRECEATVFGSGPVCLEDVLFGKYGLEVFNVGFVGVLDAKVVDDQGEFDVSGIVLPKTGGNGAGRVAVGLEELGKSFVGDDAGLWEAIHASFNSYAHVTIFD